MNTTKYRILSGAKEIFVSNSFHGTSLDKLLSTIQVSKGSFFHYFKSKNDLLSELIEFEAKHLFAKLEQFLKNSVNPLATLNDFLDWRLENYEETGRLIAKLGAELGSEDEFIQKRIKKIYGDYLAYLIQLIQRAKDSKQLVDSAPVLQLANFILYGLEGGNMSVTLIESKEQYLNMVDMIKRVVRSFRNINF